MSLGQRHQRAWACPGRSATLVGYCIAADRATQDSGARRLLVAECSHQIRAGRADGDAHPTVNPDRPAWRQPFHGGVTRGSPIPCKAPTVRRVKRSSTAYRVTDLAVSLDFYCARGYQEAGRINLGDGTTLTVLRFPRARRPSPSS